jgi:hypothetical protein
MIKTHMKEIEIYKPYIDISKRISGYFDMIRAPTDEWRRMSMTDEEQRPACCPVFGVESGVPVIGLGFLVILFGIIPVLILPAGMMPVPVSALMVGFGIFLIWIGITQ